MKKLAALFLILPLLLTACASSTASTNLMEDVPARVICLAEEPDCAAEAADFSLRLFQNSLEPGQNTLVSPLSVLSALGMTANGASDDTLTQMEQTLGMTTQDLNSYLYSYMDGQSDTLRLANSIWFKETPSLTVQEPFLETNADFYMADIFEAPFDDTTLTDINRWVEEKTDGTIPAILDEIPDAAVLYLINALAFEADWEEPYREHQVAPGTFTTEDGVQQSVDFLFSSEYHYLEDENATGFLKYYEGRKYAFAALLPNEGISVEDYVNSLTGAHLQQLLSSPQEITVYADMPKFEAEYSVELSNILQSMGMTDAFDPDNADFTAMATSDNGNISISRVLHKTYISVAEQGTKAGAATVVEAAEGAAMIADWRSVTLDRPFVYMLIDCEETLPLFLGTLMTTT